MKKLFRLEPFPLKHAAKKSMNREFQRIRRLSKQGKYDRHIEKDEWFIKNQERYKTVQLAKREGRWWLAYEGEPNTGGFKTRIEAINWFIRGGR